MIYYMPCLKARYFGSVKAFIYSLNNTERYLISYHFWTVMCMRPSIHRLRDPPWYFSICFNFSTIRSVFMKWYVSNDLPTEKGGLWNLTYSFFFFSQYYCMILLMMWYFWSMLILFSPRMMFILKIFSFDHS